MGFDISRFSSSTSSLNPAIFCPICKKVFDDPVQLDCVKKESKDESEDNETSVGHDSNNRNPGIKRQDSKDIKNSKNSASPENNKKAGEGSSSSSPSNTSSLTADHIFCRTCIVEYFAESGIICPLDGEKFKRNTKRSLIQAPPKPIFDILSVLDIKCDFNGCSKVIKLKELVDHQETCQFRDTLPILKISLSGYGNSYSSNRMSADDLQTSSSSHPSTPATIPGNHISQMGAQKGSSDVLDERLKKIEKKYIEKLETTKHQLEAKLEETNQEQLERIEANYQRDIENLQRSHQCHLSLLQEKFRKEVDGLKRHWVSEKDQDTQKPLKKQKLRRSSLLDANNSPELESSGRDQHSVRREMPEDVVRRCMIEVAQEFSASSDNSEHWTRDSVLNSNGILSSPHPTHSNNPSGEGMPDVSSTDPSQQRIYQRLEQISRSQKRELTQMIKVEMIKTEKMLMKELKDVTDGLKRELLKELESFRKSSSKSNSSSLRQGKTLLATTSSSSSSSTSPYPQRRPYSAPSGNPGNEDLPSENRTRGNRSEGKRGGKPLSMEKIEEEVKNLRSELQKLRSSDQTSFSGRKPLKPSIVSRAENLRRSLKNKLKPENQESGNTLTGSESSLRVSGAAATEPRDVELSQEDPATEVAQPPPPIMRTKRASRIKTRRRHGNKKSLQQRKKILAASATRSSLPPAQDPKEPSAVTPAETPPAPIMRKKPGPKPKRNLLSSQHPSIGKRRRGRPKKSESLLAPDVLRSDNSVTTDVEPVDWKMKPELSAEDIQPPAPAFKKRGGRLAVRGRRKVGLRRSTRQVDKPVAVEQPQRISKRRTSSKDGSEKSSSVKSTRRSRDSNTSEKDIEREVEKVLQKIKAKTSELPKLSDVHSKSGERSASAPDGVRKKRGRPPRTHIHRTIPPPPLHRIPKTEPIAAPANDDEKTQEAPAPVLSLPSLTSEPTKEDKTVNLPEKTNEASDKREEKSQEEKVDEKNIRDQNEDSQEKIAAPVLPTHVPSGNIISSASSPTHNSSSCPLTSAATEEKMVMKDNLKMTPAEGNENSQGRKSINTISSQSIPSLESENSKLEDPQKKVPPADKSIPSPQVPSSVSTTKTEDQNDVTPINTSQNNDQTATSPETNCQTGRSFEPNAEKHEMKQNPVPQPQVTTTSSLSVQPSIPPPGTKIVVAISSEHKKPNHAYPIITSSAGERSTSKNVHPTRRGGDDILRAAMDAINSDPYGGMGDMSETPTIINQLPLPPVATIAGKQFFASFPLSIPFSLPVSLPVFGPRVTPPKDKAPAPTVKKTPIAKSSDLKEVQTASTSSITSNTSCISSTLSIITPEGTHDKKGSPVTVQKPVATRPASGGPSPVPFDGGENGLNCDGAHSQGDNSSAESTLPFRKRRNATCPKDGCVEESSSEHLAPSEVNIINQILQIEENLKPGCEGTSCNPKSAPEKGSRHPVVDDLDENYALISEQILNEMSSNNGGTNNGHPLQPSKDRDDPSGGMLAEKVSYQKETQEDHSPSYAVSYSPMPPGLPDCPYPSLVPPSPSVSSFHIPPPTHLYPPDVSLSPHHSTPSHHTIHHPQAHLHKSPPPIPPPHMYEARYPAYPHPHDPNGASQAMTPNRSPTSPRAPSMDKQHHSPHQYNYGGHDTSGPSGPSSWYNPV